MQTAARVGLNPANGQTVPQVLIGAFVPNTGNVLNGMVVGTDSTYPTGFMVQQAIHPEPRFGFAYDVFGDGNTAIRGGFGITHVTRTSSNTPNTQARINPPQQFSPIYLLRHDGHAAGRDRLSESDDRVRLG